MSKQLVLPCLSFLILLLLSNLTVKPMPAQTTNTCTLFDFNTEATSGKWLPVNDTVMGGVSNSDFVVSSEGFGEFSGTVSLENNGGFASIRTLVNPSQFEGRSGIKMRVRGDGNSYSFRLRRDRRFDGVSFRHSFDTVKGEWIEISIPFEAFIPTFRGRTLRNVAALDPATINQLGFLISDKQSGTFTLQIDWLACF